MNVMIMGSNKENMKNNNGVKKMNKSESIKELAGAMAKAQGEFAGAAKDSANPFFKSKYADLESCVSAIKPSLAKYGLSFIQISHEAENSASIETVILHSSGEWLSAGVVSVPVSKSDAQGFGSAMTYARRYSLSAAFGIAPEDDDGNAASKAKPQSVTKDIWDTMTPAKQAELQSVADTVRGLLDIDMALAIGCFHDVTDADEKTALWSRFDSKERSKIKAYKPA
jgi:hypothetical protein